MEGARRGAEKVDFKRQILHKQTMVRFLKTILGQRGWVTGTVATEKVELGDLFKMLSAPEIMSGLVFLLKFMLKWLLKHEPLGAQYDRIH
jgi:hypothetical protein